MRTCMQMKHYGLATVAPDRLPRVVDELERFKVGALLSAL